MRSHERGGSTVELAIAIPLFILLTIGVFDFGRAVWIRNSMTHATNEAARYAAVRSAESPRPATVASIKRLVERWLPKGSKNRLTVRTTWTPANTRGSTVQVSASYRYEPLIPMLPVEAIALTTSSRKLISY